MAAENTDTRFQSALFLVGAILLPAVGHTLVVSGTASGADPGGDEGARRYWTDSKGKPLFSGFLLEDADPLRFRTDDGTVVTKRRAEVSAGDLHYIRYWKDPARRQALRKFASNVHCNDDGSIGLMLSQAGCTDNDLKLVAALPEITAIELYQCEITDDGLAALIGLRNLRSLHVGENRIKGPGFRHIAQIASLEELEYSPDRGADQTVTAHIPHLTSLKRLKKLSLTFCKVGGRGLKPIGELTNLESLNLMDAEIESPALEHLRKLTKLRELELGGDSISGADLVHIAGLSELRRLDLSGADLTSGGLQHLAKLSKLERLLLPQRMDNDGLKHLGGLGKLTFLSLWGEKITDDGLAHLKALVNLEELILPGGITNAGLKHLTGLNRLRRLEFVGDNVTFSGAMALLVDGQKRTVADAMNVLTRGEERGAITNLSLDFRPKADKEALKYLSSLPDLESLSFGKDTTDEWLAEIGKVKKLSHLQFRGEPFDRAPVKLTAAGLKHLAACPKLETLNFDGCALGDDALAAAPLPALKSLQFMSCKLGAGNIAAIGRMQSLESLYFDSTNLADADLRHFTSLNKLQFLNLPEGITLKGLAQLKGLKGLKRLQAHWRDFAFADVLKLLTGEFGLALPDALALIMTVTRTPDGTVTGLDGAYDLKVTADDLKFLRSLPALQSLTLPPGVTDDCLAQLKPLAKLKRLSFEGQLVTNDGFAHLAGLSELEELWTNQAAITDAGLKHLAGLKKLKSVDLSNSKVTERGIAELQKALPQASIRK